MKDRPDKYDLCACGARKAKISKQCFRCSWVSRRVPEEIRLERRRASVRAWYRRNTARVAAWQKSYTQTPEGREVRLKADRKRYNKERGREHRFRYHLQLKYQLTVEAYDQMYDKQEGCCAITSCRVQFGGRRPWEAPGPTKPCVDHRHDHHLVRGLLCKRCNTAMGIVDKAELLNALINYRDSVR
jgi:hypothetical protein